METLTNDHQNIDHAVEKSDLVSVIIVPFPAQGHLNQMIQLSCLISSSYALPVHYVGSAIHNRQAKHRVNGLNPLDVAKIHFHDLPIPSFPSPPPNPNESNRFPSQLQPAWDATLNMRQPFSDFMRGMSERHRRVVVIHDPLISAVVQDVVSLQNAESYALNCISAFCNVQFLFEQLGKPCPLDRLRELPSIEECISDDLQRLIVSQQEAMEYKAGDLYNTCRLLEAPFLDIVEVDHYYKKK